MVRSLFSLFKESYTKDPVLMSERLLIRLPKRSDYPAWAALRKANHTHLQPWEPRWSSDHLSKSSFWHRVSLAKREAESDSSYRFLLFLSNSRHLIGGITLSNIRRGPLGSANLGYWLGANFEHSGYMQEALTCIINYTFYTLELRRIEAQCLPDNSKSINLLKKLMFQQEGVAKRYLEINGEYRDHLLFARLAKSEN